MHGRTLRSPKRQADFLRLLAKGASVAAAALAVGCQRRTVYDWRADDDEFRTAWDDAIEAATDLLEDEARRRALDQSDLLLIFLLRSRRPHIYHQRQAITVAGDPNSPIGVAHSVQPGSNVHFYLPHNHRDRPEQETDEPRTIEGAIDDGEDEAAA